MHGLSSGLTLGGAGPNWEQFQLAQVPSQHAPRSVELGAGPQLGAIGPIGLRSAVGIIVQYEGRFKFFY